MCLQSIMIVISMFVAYPDFINVFEAYPDFIIVFAAYPDCHYSVECPHFHYCVYSLSWLSLSCL